MASSHDLVLGESHGRVLLLHRSFALANVADVRQSKGATAVLVVGELGDGRIGGLLGIEADDTRAARATVGLVLNLGLLDLADGLEQLNQVVVGSRPRKLCASVSLVLRGIRFLVHGLTLRT